MSFYNKSLLVPSVNYFKLLEMMIRNTGTNVIFLSFADDMLLTFDLCSRSVIYTGGLQYGKIT